MAKGYWVVRVDVTDPEQFKIYQAFVGPFLAEHDGRFLVRGGATPFPRARRGSAPLSWNFQPTRPR